MALKEKPNPPKKPTRRKRVTARDVALHAGVSEAAVSLVLSGRDDITIAKKTRERIREKAEELGYIPSLLGKGFLQGGSRIVGMVVPPTLYGHWLTTFSTLYYSLARAGYAPLVVVPSVCARRSRTGVPNPCAVTPGHKEIRRLLQYQVDGVIYCSVNPRQAASALDELVRYGVPTVLVGTRPDDCMVDFVGIDEIKVGRLAARHLLALGASTFSVVELEAPHPSMQRRHDSFMAALAPHGASASVLAVNEGELSTLVEHLSSHTVPPVGVFAANDLLAAMTVQAALELGWRVPDDLAVIGMGNYQPTRHNTASMTAVHRNSDKAMELAADMLLERMDGYDGPPRNIQVAPRLVVRPSPKTSSKKHRPARRHT